MNPFLHPLSVDHSNVTPADVEKHRSEVRIIDVREPDEFRGDLGHIPGAELVPLRTLGTAARTWKHDERLVVVCRSGGRSSQAAAALAHMGFHRVHNMLGGMLRWRAEGREAAR